MFFASAQFSQKLFKFSGEGGTSKNIQDSPILDPSFSVAYNAPYFDATDPETRENRQLAASLSYFLTTKGFGRHDMKLGYENFRSTRTGGNSQSSTNFVYVANYLQDANGNPVTTSDGNFIPLWQPGTSLSLEYLATRGARLDLTTQSLFFNDRWQLDNHWSFNLGARYEKTSGSATGGLAVVDAKGPLVPRLGVSYDVNGDGKYKLDATYAHYAGGYNAAQFGSTTNVGNPNGVYSVYVGPAGQGRDFAPGFDAANYQIFQGVFPTANIFFDKNLSSPVTKEITFSAGVGLGRGGFLKGIYSHRKISNFVEDFQDIALGATTVVQNGINFGTFQNTFYKNSDFPTREYSALSFQGEYKLTDHWVVSGNWTHQFKNDGNYEGEGLQQVGLTTLYGNYTNPALFSEARNYPSGHLIGYEADRARAWTTYDLGLGKAGNVGLGLLFWFDSPTTYSHSAGSVPLSSVQQALGQAYASIPASQTLFFGGRGDQSYNNNLYRLDFAITYQIPVFKSAKPYVKFDLRDVFNYDTPLQFNTTIAPDNNGPVDSLGLPLNYIKGGKFGQATKKQDFTLQRTYDIALGFRF
jgi:hypothetical protein